MPPPGHKSVTLPNDVMGYLSNEWKQRQTELRKKGVRSFSGFVTFVFFEWIEDLKKPRFRLSNDLTQRVGEVIKGEKLGYGSCEEFVEDAVRRRLEELQKTFLERMGMVGSQPERPRRPA